MAKSFAEALADLRAAVAFNRKVIADNPPIETGAWNDAFQWVMNAAHHLAEAEGPAVPDDNLLAQFNRHRLLEIIVTGPDASGAEQNSLARIALTFYPQSPDKPQ
ncbi:hypothetical protein MHZ90_14730 [Pantoea sp. ACRSH]|uniref:hypothetical protein n=1 Tax=unclassified Pantoea TaxID=2630326 RepID=UPI001EF67635|nr:MULTISPECIES: hypothetical protein [unclassified Pantoea]MCG7367376.1 hypothetical protein [Pantoea sp. ACRSH]MCG7397669.1 hypothetical protein [Pantoea sp. ACRSC]